MSDAGQGADVGGLVEALEVRRNAAIGFGIGGAVGTVAFAYRVGELAGPVADTRGSPLLFAVLAFVLVVTVGLLVTGLLVARTAIGLARA